MHINEDAPGITDTLHIDGMPAVSVAIYVCNMVGWLECHMGAIYCTQHTWEVGYDVEIPGSPLPFLQCLWHSDVEMCKPVNAVQNLQQTSALACLRYSHNVSSDPLEGPRGKKMESSKDLDIGRDGMGAASHRVKVLLPLTYHLQDDIWGETESGPDIFTGHPK